MKNKTITSTLALSLLLGSAPAFADGSTSPTPATNNVTTTVNQTTQPQAVNPDSLLYSLKELLDQIKLLITFNDINKADLLMQQANDKISELQVLKSNGTEKYDEEYNQKINDLLKKTEQVLKTASNQMKDEDKETQEKEKQEIDKKQANFAEIQKHSIAVLKANLAKVPEQGRKGILNAIAKQEATTEVIAPTSPETQTNTQSQPVTVQTQAQSQTQVQIATSTESNVSIQAKSEETYHQKEDDKLKHDNGLHLGQLKHQEEKEHEHKK